MKQSTTEAAGHTIMTVAGATGIGSSWLGYLNNNAAGLGLILSFIGLIIASIFYWLTYVKSTKADDNEKKIEELLKHLKGDE